MDRSWKVVENAVHPCIRPRSFGLSTRTPWHYEHLCTRIPDPSLISLDGQITAKGFRRAVKSGVFHRLVSQERNMQVKIRGPCNWERPWRGTNFHPREVQITDQATMKARDARRKTKGATLSSPSMRWPLRGELASGWVRAPIISPINRRPR